MNQDSHPLMATCRVCGGSISKQAAACPHCGQLHPFRKKTSMLKIILLIFMLGGIINAFTNLSSGTPPAVTASNTDKLRELCIGGIRATVTNPSTLDIHYLTGYAHDVIPGGTERMVQTFSAKNAFGLEKTYDAQCLLHPDGKLDFRVVEQVD